MSMSDAIFLLCFALYYYTTTIWEKGKKAEKLIHYSQKQHNDLVSPFHGRPLRTHIGHFSLSCVQTKNGYLLLVCDFNENFFIWSFDEMKHTFGCTFTLIHTLIHMCVCVHIRSHCELVQLNECAKLSQKLNLAYFTN